MRDIGRLLFGRKMLLKKISKICSSCLDIFMLARTSHKDYYLRLLFIIIRVYLKTTGLLRPTK